MGLQPIPFSLSGTDPCIWYIGQIKNQKQSIVNRLVQFHWEIVSGIVEADILDHFSQQGHIARQEP